MSKKPQVVVNMPDRLKEYTHIVLDEVPCAGRVATEKIKIVNRMEEANYTKL